MPGFVINGIGKGASSSVVPYYNYTWEINQLFGSAAASTATIFAKEITLPTFGVTKEEVSGASLKYKYAGEIHWDDVRVTFYDTQGLCSILKQWRGTVWQPSTGLGLASDYKKDSSVNLFTGDGDMDKGWLMHGSWPSEIKEGELTYASSEFKYVVVQVAYDWAEETGTDSG